MCNIEKYREYLKQKTDLELRDIENAITQCDFCVDNKKDYFKCLHKKGLTLSQIGILHDVSRQYVHQKIRF